MENCTYICYCGKAIKTSLTINMYCDECLKLEEMKYWGFYSTLKSDQGYAVLEYSRYDDACYNTRKARRVFNGFQSAKEAEEVARTLAKVNDGWLTSFMLEGGSSITSPHPAYDKTGL